jgi:hypothetical protein
VSSVSETAGRSPGRIGAAVVLTVIAVVLLIAAVIYFTEPAHSLPAILGTLKQGPHITAKRADAHRTLRGVVTLVVALLCLGAGVFVLMWRGKERN